MKWTWQKRPLTERKRPLRRFGREKNYWTLNASVMVFRSMRWTKVSLRRISGERGYGRPTFTRFPFRAGRPSQRPNQPQEGARLPTQLWGAGEGQRRTEAVALSEDSERKLIVLSAH